MRATADRAVVAPVDLGAFAGRKGELEKRFAAHRANLANVVLDDRDAALETVFMQKLEDLLRAVRVRLQETYHPGLERIEPAAARHGMSSAVRCASRPLADRLHIQPEARAVWAMVSCLILQ